MDRHQFFHLDSCHPKHCETAISYSWELCLQWICLEDEDFIKTIHDLKNYHLKCGHNEQNLNYELQRMLDIPRDMCLQLKRNQCKSAQTPLVVTYHHSLPSFCLTTKHHLSKKETTPPFMPHNKYGSPSCFQHWLPSKVINLRDCLVRATLTSIFQEPLANHLRGLSRCKTCPIFLATDEFSSHMTGQNFKVKVHASCKSSNVIYLMTCRRCGQQYVGNMEQQLHSESTVIELTLHLGEPRNLLWWAFQWLNTVASRHECHAIDQILNHDPCLWKIRESRWGLRPWSTTHPLGMNLRVDGLWNLLTLILFMAFVNPCALVMWISSRHGF